MGYYTDYYLEIDPEPNENLLNYVMKYWNKPLSDILENNVDMETKWYEHDDDMLNLSAEFPDFVFILDGEGEGKDDVWRSFYKNGKHYTWKLKYTMPEFEESKLK